MTLKTVDHSRRLVSFPALSTILSLIAFVLPPYKHLIKGAEYIVYFSSLIILFVAALRLIERRWPTRVWVIRGGALTLCVALALPFVMFWPLSSHQDGPWWLG